MINMAPDNAAEWFGCVWSALIVVAEVVMIVVMVRRK